MSVLNTFQYKQYLRILTFSKYNEYIIDQIFRKKEKKKIQKSSQWLQMKFLSM